MTMQGQQVENTLWFEFATDPAAADLIVLGTAIRDWWIAQYKPLVSSACELREVVVSSMTTASSAQVTVTPTATAAGSAGANIMPGNVTMSVSFRTALRGRSFRGRNYVAGMTEDQVAGNIFVSTITGTWKSAYEAIAAAIASTGWTWVVVSRFSGVDAVTKVPIPRATGVTTPVLAVVVVDDFVDSQRRRLAGRGN